MRIEPVDTSRGVSEASGVTRDGNRLLIVADADPGAYYSFPLSNDAGPLVQLPPDSVTRHCLSGGELGVDLEAIDVLADGRIVALSERLRSIISSNGLVFQYDDPLAELGERGLEGLAVRKCDHGTSDVAVLWEGGYVEDSEVMAQIRDRDRLRGWPLLPVILTHRIERDQRGMKIKIDSDDELVELQVPNPDSEPDGWRFRAPDLVWHKWRATNGTELDGFIVLLNSQLRRFQTKKAMFGPRWLQRFDRKGKPVGAHLDVDDIAKELLHDDRLRGANWEGLGWWDEGRRVVLVHDKSKAIDPPVALIVDLQRFWKD